MRAPKAMMAEICERCSTNLEPKYYQGICEDCLRRDLLLVERRKEGMIALCTVYTTVGEVKAMRRKALVTLG